MPPPAWVALNKRKDAHKHHTNAAHKARKKDQEEETNKISTSPKHGTFFSDPRLHKHIASHPHPTHARKTNKKKTARQEGVSIYTLATIRYHSAQYTYSIHNGEGRKRQGHRTNPNRNAKANHPLPHYPLRTALTPTAPAVHKRRHTRALKPRGKPALARRRARQALQARRHG